MVLDHGWLEECKVDSRLVIRPMKPSKTLVVILSIVNSLASYRGGLNNDITFIAPNLANGLGSALAVEVRVEDHCT